MSKRPSKTNAAIQAGIRAWWFSPEATRDRAREAASWARFQLVELPTSYEESWRPVTVVDFAKAAGHQTTPARVCVAARRWGDSGLDCGDGLVAHFGVVHSEWRIVVTGPI